MTGPSNGPRAAYRPRRGQATRVDDEKIERLANKGWAAAAIARHLRIDEVTVAQRLDRLAKSPEQRAREKDARYLTRIRACLRCKRGFESSWAGARICPKCKTVNERAGAALA